MKNNSDVTQVVNIYLFRAAFCICDVFFQKGPLDILHSFVKNRLKVKKVKKNLNRFYVNLTN